MSMNAIAALVTMEYVSIKSIHINVNAPGNSRESTVKMVGNFTHYRIQNLSG